MFELSRVSDRLNWLEREMGALFRGALPEAAGWEPGPGGFPALNAWEDSENFYLEAELPGLALETLELSVVGPELTLKGERKFQNSPGVAWHRRERVFGTFARVIELPAPVDSEKVTAAFTNGVLKVTLPKVGVAKPRRIEVKRIESKN